MTRFLDLFLLLWMGGFEDDVRPSWWYLLSALFTGMVMVWDGMIGCDFVKQEWLFECCLKERYSVRI